MHFADGEASCLRVTGCVLAKSALLAYVLLYNQALFSAPGRGASRFSIARGYSARRLRAIAAYLLLFAMCRFGGQTTSIEVSKVSLPTFRNSKLRDSNLD